MEVHLSHVARQFLPEIPESKISITPHGVGLINSTFLVVVSPPSTGRDGAPAGAPSPPEQSEHRECYILQRINTTVFHNPRELMENARRITTHLARSGARCLEFLSTREGVDLVEDGEGEFWRLSPFIQDSYALEIPRTPDDAYHAARAFGLYQEGLSDLPGPRLFETIPRFHDTPARYARFCRVLQEDRCDRASRGRAETTHILGSEKLLHTLHDLHFQGALPERITHNDTKISNVLFDRFTHQPVCVIDLDTTMPGFVAHDFGDLVRTAAVIVPEDSAVIPPDILSEELFDAVSRGYIETTSSFLTVTERETLVLGAIVIALEQAMRFLTDFLEGDVYYTWESEDHNLRRCRTQLSLAAALDGKRSRLEKRISQYSRL
jgi:hypothetical protein